MYCAVGIAMLFLFFSCQSSFKKTSSGLRYKILKAGNTKKKAKEGDFIDFHFVIKNYKDSVLSSTYVPPGQPYLNQPVMKSNFKGDLNEVLMLLSEGDSALVLISADTIANVQKKQIESQIKLMEQQLSSAKAQKGKDEKFIKDYEKNVNDQIANFRKQLKNPLPAYIKSGTDVKYFFKIMKIRTKAEIEKEREEAMKKEKERAEKQKQTDKNLIENYIKKNQLAAKSTASGLYYVLTEEGNGPMAASGDSVKVNYTGMLLNGKVFDTSDEQMAEKSKIKNPERKYEPFTLPVGMGQVIKGWDEGLQLVKAGSKVKLLIPSNLAYGNQPAGKDIPANSVLIFDIELIEVIKVKK